MSYDRIRVLITPLHYEGIYGDVQDVTENVDITAFVKDNIQSIRNEIDSGDFDIGLFTFGTVKLSCFNDDGIFSPPEDPRSMFGYKRDLAKVKIQYLDKESNVYTVFEGLINEDTVKDEQLPEDDLSDSVVSFRVLSYDSIFRHVQVAGGTIATGVSLSTAIKQIMNTTQITNVLNYDPNNIEVDTDVTIDDGDYFGAKTVKQALDDLLLAANAVLLIDENQKIIVTPRTEVETLHNFFAPHDPLGRGNILEIKNYNTGLQRCFSAVQVNETEVIDQAAIDDYGYRLKSINLDFINTPESEELIATNILNEFKTPRIEFELKASFEDAVFAMLRDKASIDYPLRVIPPEGSDKIVTLNTLSLGDMINQAIGSININPAHRFKVIGTQHNPRTFTTTLKFRQTGKLYGQGIA